MKKQRKPEVIDPENPEWTAAKFKRAKPFKDLPPVIQRALLGLKAKPKPVSVDIDPALAKKLDATGSRLQTKVNRALREWVKDHPAKPRKAST